ncbi:MAG TPA: S26 family signal peptidase [Pseudobdellovibrionaceae bacterium]|nr:S26 family signal peptidase [Pseudobdellovibrionaceae bacterium]
MGKKKYLYIFFVILSFGSALLFSSLFLDVIEFLYKKPATAGLLYRTIRGHSMVPTFMDGEIIAIHKDIPPMDKINKNMHLVLQSLGLKDSLILKQVVATPGDSIRLELISNSNYVLYINEEILELPKGQKKIFSKSQIKILDRIIRSNQGRIPEASLLVLGISSDSIDSSLFGLIGPEHILGYVLKD